MQAGVGVQVVVRVGTGDRARDRERQGETSFIHNINPNQLSASTSSQALVRATSIALRWLLDSWRACAAT